MNLDIGAKRLGLLNDLIPGASCLAVLVDPTSIFTQPIVDDLHEAASKIGRQIEPFAAGSPREIDLSFAKIAEKHCKGLLVAPMPLFFDLRLKNLRWPLDTPFLPSIPRASGRRPVESSATDQAFRINSGKPRSMRAAYSMGKHQRSCQFCGQRNSNWSSIFKPPRRSAWRYRPIYSLSPMRSSSEWKAPGEAGAISRCKSGSGKAVAGRLKASVA